MFCLQGKPGQFQVPPCIPPPELFWQIEWRIVARKFTKNGKFLSTDDTDRHRWKAWSWRSRNSRVGSAVSADRLYVFRLWRPTFRRWITPGGPPVASKGKQLFVCRGNQDSSWFPLASLLLNFHLIPNRILKASKDCGFRLCRNVILDIEIRLSRWILDIPCWILDIQCLG